MAERPKDFGRGRKRRGGNALPDPDRFFSSCARATTPQTAPTTPLSIHISHQTATASANGRRGAKRLRSNGTPEARDPQRGARHPTRRLLQIAIFCRFCNATVEGVGSNLVAEFTTVTLYGSKSSFCCFGGVGLRDERTRASIFSSNCLFSSFRASESVRR